MKTNRGVRAGHRSFGQLESLEQRRMLSGHVWTGAVSANWSNDANWIGGAPAAGELNVTLAFGNQSTTAQSVNDIAGLSFDTLTVTKAHTITGQALSTTAVSIITSQIAPLVIDNPLNLTDNLLLEGWININGLIDGNGGLTAVGKITLTANNLYTGPTVADGLLLRIEGNQPGSVVTLKRGLLAGDGIIGALTCLGGCIGDAQTGLVVNNQPSMPTIIGGVSGMFDVAPTYGTFNRPMRVQGEVDLTQAPSLFNGKWGALTVGQQYLMVDNDGNDPVGGIFQDLPEGALMSAGGGQYQYIMRISYVGGDGNDVVLVPMLHGLKETQSRVTASKQVVLPGEEITFTVSVRGLLAGQGTPAGYVKIYDEQGREWLVRLDVNGSASLTKPCEVGSEIHVSYIGDAQSGFLGSSESAYFSPIVLQENESRIVGKAYPTINPNKVLLKATVYTAGAGGVQPTGMVWFRYEGVGRYPDVELGSAAVADDGTATLLVDISDLKSPMMDMLLFTARYGGDEHFDSDSSWQIAYTPDTVWATELMYTDLNGDGDADILYRSRWDGTYHIRYNDAQGESQNYRTLPATSADWRLDSVVDLTGDGNAELLWRNTTNGKVVAWILTPDGGYQFACIGAGVVKAGWYVAGSGDFNGDDTNDLLWRNSITGKNAVWYMRGKQTRDVSMFNYNSANLDWGIGEIGDFNNDGKADLLWRNNKSGQNYIWFLDGTKVTGGKSLDALQGAGWEVAGVFDLDGDDEEDILFYNHEQGKFLAWFMDAGVIRSAEPYVPGA